ncbi:MAG TPA: MFS transporter [Herpetosiphonaceae bacterium]
MLSVLRRRNFSLLLLSGIVSLIGDWMLFVALPLHVFALTGSTLATGVTFIVESLPRVLLGTVAGVFVDRWNQKTIMIVADVVRAVAILSLLLADTADHVWIVYVVAATVNTASQFFTPAENALFPRLLSKEDLMPANALNSLGVNMTRLLGPAIGGSLMVWLGFQAIVLLDSLTFVLSCVLISFVRVQTPREASPEQQPRTAQLGSVWRDWWSGLRLVRRNPTIMSIFLIIATMMPAEGILQVLFAIFVKQVLQGDASTYGLVLSAQAIGGLLGSLVIGKLGKLLPPYWLMGISGVLNGILLLIIFNFPSLPVALSLFVVAGLPVGAFFVSLQTLLQTHTPQEFLGRVFGAFGTTVALMTLSGMLIATLLADAIGITLMLDMVGTLNIAAGLVSFLLLRRASAPAAAPVAATES